jgi:hypothetical protein
VTGLLRGEAPIISRNWYAHPVLAGATVTVVGGEASGTSTTTREDGSFEVAAAGMFKLRFEHPGFITSESSDTVMIAGGVTLPDVTLATAPWSISDVITDSLGNPVPDADVTVFAAEFRPLVTVKTNASGRYTASSTLPLISGYATAKSSEHTPRIHNSEAASKSTGAGHQGRYGAATALMAITSSWKGTMNT